MTGFAAARPSPLRDRYLAAVIRCLLDGVDETVQLDRGCKGRLTAFAVTDRPGEQRVHLTDVEGFTRRRIGCRQGEALGHRDRRKRVVAFGALQDDLAQLR